MTQILDTLLNSVTGRFLILSALLGAITQGIKVYAAQKGSFLRAVLMAVPALWGIVFGCIPGVFPKTDVGTSILLGGLAGALSAYAFDAATTTAQRLQAWAKERTDRALDEPPSTPMPRPPTGEP